MKKPIESSFRNTERLDKLYKAFQEGNKNQIQEIIDNHIYNRDLNKKIDAKDIEWIELKEDIVYRLSTPTENVVIKIFSNDYDYPLAEICGNIVATHLLQVIPFFVRTLDIGKRDDQVVIIMEYLQSDTETIDLESPVNLYNFFYQTAYALAELEKLCHLVHFDLRYDNIMVKMLPQPRDFFNNGILCTFIVKIGDFGQCEMDFGKQRRLVNPDVPREERYLKKWGLYPKTFSGYDFQYLLSSLTPILDNLQGVSYYYIYGMLLDYLQPVEFTKAQHRPLIITSKLPKDILMYLKQVVSKTL